MLPRRRFCALPSIFLILFGFLAPAGSAEGLKLTAVDKTSDAPVPARMILSRADGRQQVVRRTVSSGIGFVLQPEQRIAVPPGNYNFQVIRGPEYRIITGNFLLERGGVDLSLVQLPRMVDLSAEGWWSGDAAARGAADVLPLLMQSEDLHYLGHVQPERGKRVLSDRPLPVGGMDADWGPLAIRSDLAADGHGLLLVGVPEGFSIPDSNPSSDTIRVAVQRQIPTIVIEDPFAWDLPIWLASDRISAIFVLGDWLRLDHTVDKIRTGRPPTEVGYTDALGPGRWAEQIYWKLLDAGLKIPPLAGSGSQVASHPVGYNRTYVWSPDTTPTIAEWWQLALAGHSVLTNGPLLRPTLGGEPPGHRFQATQGEVLELGIELNLAVRDPVDYLEVIHNGEVYYSARLEEFAGAGGMIPPLRVEASGWVLVRVVTMHEEHFRAAISAPWYIDFDGQPRIVADAVEFFRKWLTEREAMLSKLPSEQRQQHAKFVTAARKFWQRQADRAAAP